MAFQLEASLARRLICDPVMAAEVLLNAELDIFQAARLRHWWFTPTTMDHSGVSTAKSEMAFLFVFLRLMLLPLAAPRKPRIVSVYYQSQGTGLEVFLPKLDEYLSKSKIFHRQVQRQHAGKYYQVKKNVVIIAMRGGGWCELPAGDFLKDSQNMASKRVNDTVIDEGAMIDQLGKGLNKQILQRNTRESFNPNHPVHANHTVFLGHAEGPDHIYHKRYAGIRKAIRSRGSQNHCAITSSYKDYRGEHLRKYGQDVAKKAAEQYLTDLDEAEHAQIYDGLWKRGGKGLYSETMRDGVLDPAARVHFKRRSPQIIYHLGWDTAASMTDGSDWSAGVAAAATPAQKIIPGMPGYIVIDEQLWLLQIVYAIFLHRSDIDQKSGLIHRLHQAFGFNGITLDSRGGGVEVYQHLRKSQQLINNVWVETTGLCRPKESFLYPGTQPLISFYDRGEPLFEQAFGEKYVADNTGPIDYAHRQLRGIMRSRQMAWPLGPQKLDAVQSAALSIEEATVLTDIERALGQFANIAVKVDKDKKPLISQKGFQMFTNTLKKDGAMATIYAVLGLINTIQKGGGRKPAEDAGSNFGVF